MEFAVPSVHGIKLKESEKRYENQDLARGLKQPMKYESHGDRIVIGALVTVPVRLLKALEHELRSPKILY